MKRYLLFDSDCSLCTEVARRVEEAAGGWLEARSLRDPEMRALLDRAKPGWKWEPTLVEVDGDEVRVYQGLGMRVRMVRGLGVRRGLEVISLAYHSTTRFDHGRREFLKNAGILAGLTLLNIKAPPALSLLDTEETIQVELLKIDDVTRREKELIENAKITLKGHGILSFDYDMYVYKSTIRILHDRRSIDVNVHNVFGVKWPHVFMVFYPDNILKKMGTTSEIYMGSAYGNFSRLDDWSCTVGCANSCWTRYWICVAHGQDYSCYSQFLHCLNDCCTRCPVCIQLGGPV